MGVEIYAIVSLFIPSYEAAISGFCFLFPTLSSLSSTKSTLLSPVSTFSMLSEAQPSLSAIITAVPMTVPVLPALYQLVYASATKPTFSPPCSPPLASSEPVSISARSDSWLLSASSSLSNDCPLEDTRESSFSRFLYWPFA